MSFHKHNVFAEIDPQIATLGMLVYIHFYCISEHLGDWGRGNMNILRIGAKMTSGEPLIFKIDSPRCSDREARKWGGGAKPKSLILAESS